MKTYKSISALPRMEEASITIGNFDGLHIGHQKILRILCEGPRNKPSIAITFESAPIETLNPKKFRGYIFPREYKKIFLAEYGIGHVVSLDFKKVRDIPAGDFIDSILKKVKNARLYVGYNFRFGKGNTGSAQTLKELSEKKGFQLTVVDKIICGNRTVSSSLIRDLISEGNVEEAGEFLGRPYFLAGKSEKGDGIGRKIGFPTINLGTGIQVLPKDGVYFTLYFYRGKFYPSMTYVGKRPSVAGTDGNVRIETNILAGKEAMAGSAKQKEHRIFFIRRTRGEKKLHNLDELRDILYNDRKIILDLHRDYTVPKTLLRIFTEE